VRDIATLFTALWGQTEQDLARASVRPRLSTGTVAYRSHAVGLEVGSYHWNAGAPRIRLYRSGNLPDDAERPDLVTQPIDDACILAYERGHFISDPLGERSQSAYASFREGYQLMLAQKTVIFEEERRAWHHARVVMMRLGWTDWASFEALQWRLLHGYSEGLSQLRE
jgi:hypothetical protein